MPLCQQERSSLFSQSSNYSFCLSQLSNPSQSASQNTSASATQSSSQSAAPGESRTDSGVVTVQPQSFAATRRTRSKKNAWESYLATKPLTAGEANCSRKVSGRRHNIEVSLKSTFFYYKIYPAIQRVNQT